MISFLFKAKQKKFNQAWGLPTVFSNSHNMLICQVQAFMLHYKINMKLYVSTQHNNQSLGQSTAKLEKVGFQ